MISVTALGTLVRSVFTSCKPALQAFCILRRFGIAVVVSSHIALRAHHDGMSVRIVRKDVVCWDREKRDVELAQDVHLYGMGVQQ